MRISPVVALVPPLLSWACSEIGSPNAGRFSRRGPTSAFNCSLLTFLFSNCCFSPCLARLQRTLCSGLPTVGLPLASWWSTSSGPCVASRAAVMFSEPTGPHQRVDGCFAALWRCRHDAVSTSTTCVVDFAFPFFSHLAREGSSEHSCGCSFAVTTGRRSMKICARNGGLQVQGLMFPSGNALALQRQWRFKDSFA